MISSPENLILTPLQIEQQALLDAFKKLGFDIIKESINKHTLWICPELKAAIALSGHGKAQTALQTQFFLGHLTHVEQVLLVGAAGGLADALNVFDVVAASSTIEHDYRERFSPKASAPEFLGSPNLLEKIDPAMFNDFRLHIGRIASGDEDIIDNRRAQELSRSTHALAVAWEGAGFARAALFNKKALLEIRGITDTANSTAPADFRSNVKQALENAASVINKILAH